MRLVQEVRSLNRLGIPVESTRPFLECLAAGRDHADDYPESLATYRHAITELTRRIGALAVKREVLLTQLHDAANGNTPAALTEPRRHRRP
ncbi:MAG: hypothetical protein M3Z25_10670 [Actinomycetota bacterium]|nr:hypothetical protein [Actinomycetota bacterium]